MLFPIYLLIGLFFMKLFDNSKHSFSSNLIFTISFIFLLSLNLINIFEEKKVESTHESKDASGIH